MPGRRVRVRYVQSGRWLTDAPPAVPHLHGRRRSKAGISTFDLSRFMGASLEQNAAAYGHLAIDSKERAVAMLAADDVRQISDRERTP